MSAQWISTPVDDELHRLWRASGAARLLSDDLQVRIVERGVEFLGSHGNGDLRAAMDEAAHCGDLLLDEIAETADVTAEPRAAALTLRATGGDVALAETALRLAKCIDAEIPVVGAAAEGDVVDPPAVRITTGAVLVRDSAATPRERRRLDHPYLLVVDGAADEELVGRALRKLAQDDRTLLVVCHRGPEPDAAGWDRDVVVWPAPVERETLERFADAVGAVPARGTVDRTVTAIRRRHRAALLDWTGRDGPLNDEGAQRLADLLVEALLDDDETSLSRGLLALQDRWARERQIEPDGSLTQGRLLAWTGFARWAQTRVPPAELHHLRSSWRLREVLKAIAARPGVASSALAAELEASDSEISRSARRLLELDLVRRTRAGRTIHWEATAKGAAVVDADAPEPQREEQVDRCAHAAETAVSRGDEGSFRLLAVALVDAARTRNLAALEAIETQLAASRAAEAVVCGRLGGFGLLTSAAHEQADAQLADARRGRRLADRMLVEVTRNPQLTTGDLAQRLHVPASSVSRIGRRLVEDGLVERATVGRERRWSPVRGRPFELGEAATVLLDEGRLAALHTTGDETSSVAILELAPSLADDPARVRLLERALEVARVARLDEVVPVYLLGLVSRLLPAEQREPMVNALLGSLHGSVSMVGALSAPLLPASFATATEIARELLRTATADAQHALPETTVMA